MIRTLKPDGSLFIGLERALVDRLLAGEPVCLPEHRDGSGAVHPHVCLLVRETNRELAAVLVADARREEGK